MIRSIRSSTSFAFGPSFGRGWCSSRAPCRSWRSPRRRRISSRPPRTAVRHGAHVAAAPTARIAAPHPNFFHIAPPPPGAELDWCFVLAAYYAIYYILLEKNLAGFTGAALVIASWVTASWFQKEGGALFDMTSWKAALNGHVAAWTLQFLGHGIWEKRTPALMDNPSQAFLMAPMFVLLEFFFLFGYRPALYSSAMAQVEKNVAAFKASKAKKGN
mmetsp:Transcript_7105/g.20766  ORF Transcript_7105/g.20766 Transcript_7105/m.20766 type:complete len:216 (-) Transcript_7105:457-1104(-)